jgi:hypothetical protein
VIPEYLTFVATGLRLQFIEMQLLNRVDKLTTYMTDMKLEYMKRSDDLG